MKEILNKVYSGSVDNYYEFLEQQLESNKKRVIVTANPEIMMQAENDVNLRNSLLGDRTLITADGIGVVKACKYVSKLKVERLAGVETVEKMLSFADKYSKNVMVYGSHQMVLDKFKDELDKKYPHLGYLLINGYDYSDQYFKDNLKSFQPDLIFVSMGVPRQEKIIYSYFDDVDKGIFIGCGGSIDVISGSKKRAPRWIQRLNIEWLYRIIKEPKRFKRFLNNQLSFIFKVMKEMK